MPRLLTAPFRQAVFLCILAAGTAVVQLRGGSTLDPVLATGIGLLLGWLLYQGRLFILAALVLPPGIVNELFDHGLIGRYLEPAHLIAIGLGLLAVTAAARTRPNWVHPGAWSVGLVVLALGLLLLLALASSAASGVIFSFWLPAAVFGVLGLLYLIRAFIAPRAQH
jgi:hypothetical protein